MTATANLGSLGAPKCLNEGVVPTMLLCTRFGLGVQDQNWFEHRLQLLEAITAASLASQTRQDFVWTVFADAGLAPCVREELERIVSLVDRSIVYDIGPHNSRSAIELAIQLNLPRHGYLLTAIIDDDDAWRRDTVETVCALAAEWLGRNAASTRPGVGITFARGLEWLMYDLVDIDRRAQGRHIVHRRSVRPYTYPWLGMSVFVLARTGAAVTAISAVHSKMEEHLLTHGLDLIVRDDEPDMWLYVRHKQATSSVQKAKAESSVGNVEELQTHFGLDATRLNHYIATHEDYGYVLEKRWVRRRALLAREILEIEEMLATSRLQPEESQRYHQQKADRLKEMTFISRHLVGTL